MKSLGTAPERSLHGLLLSGIGLSKFDVLTLYDKATAISVGEFVLGSSKSHFFQKITRYGSPPKPS